MVIHQLKFMNALNVLISNPPPPPPPPPPDQKSCHYFAALKFQKKNFISENYNVQGVFLPNLMNVFCHHNQSGAWYACEGH